MSEGPVPDADKEGDGEIGREPPRRPLTVGELAEIVDKAGLRGASFAAIASRTYSGSNMIHLSEAIQRLGLSAISGPKLPPVQIPPNPAHETNRLLFKLNEQNAALHQLAESLLKDLDDERRKSEEERRRATRKERWMFWATVVSAAAAVVAVIVPFLVG